MNFRDYILNEDMGMPPAGGMGGDMGAPAAMPPGGGMGAPPGGGMGGGMGDPMGGMGGMGGGGAPADVSQVPLKVKDADVWSVLDTILSGPGQGGKNTKNMVEPAGRSKFLMA
jgi:hypothetical protein